MEHFIDNNGVRIHAIEYHSKAEGIPLVMVPGMGNAAEELAVCITEHLTRRTIILSLRGRGKSDSPLTGWSLEDQASDIAAVIRYFNFENVVLFGHSTGGSIATRALSMIEGKVAGFIIGDFPPVYPKYSANWAERVKKMGLPITGIALDGIVRDAIETSVMEYLKSYQ